MIQVTKEFIDEGRSAKGGLTPGQRHLLGVGWNPAPGWEQYVIGRKITEQCARLFLLRIPDPRNKPRPSTTDSDGRYGIMRRFGARRTKGLCK